MDADTKLIAGWFVGDRTSDTARLFLIDLKSRMANRMQLTSDGHRAYLKAVEHVFGDEIDYAMLNKVYGYSHSAPTAERRYSPPTCIGAKSEPIIGNPDPRHISTSFVERQNLTMRMCMRRFTRLTNAFSKKLENHALAISLHFMHYNFCRVHQTLRVTPAMAAGIVNTVMDARDIVRITDEYWAIKNPPKARGPYKSKLAA
jgi:IS1 family transposase